MFTYLTVQSEVSQIDRRNSVVPESGDFIFNLSIHRLPISSGYWYVLLQFLVGHSLRAWA